jgi:protein-L-isoaspartate(D-aspartate) O-methyltransferase
MSQLSRLELHADDLQALDPPEERGRRRALVDDLVAAGDLVEPRVVEAFLAVPRHVFVPAGLIDRAYENYPLPIGSGQTISQPTMVAIMTEALELRGGERVLEIGTGSGYQAALLALLAAQVFSVERVARLADDARARLERLGLSNVHVRVADGYLGWPEEAPFDRVVLTAAPSALPPALLEQLADGGILVAPIEDDGFQELVRVRRRGRDVGAERLGAGQFVPMIPGAPDAAERWN